MHVRTGALVSFRNAPAVVIDAAVKITIRTEGGAERKVREKDVLPIHPGPTTSLADLTATYGEYEAAWQMLEGTEVSLKELCELACEKYTPATAWTTWRVVCEGPYFEGEPLRIRARSADAVADFIAEREKKARLVERKSLLLDRIRSGKIESEDRALIGDVEALARGLTEGSRTMRDLGMREDRERAHGLLLRLGVWTGRDNPYPTRFGVPLKSPGYETPLRSETKRIDLTHLEAYAIDDDGTTAADDAVSIDGKKLWVHIADPAELVQSGDPADAEAMSRGSTLHAPESTTHMLSDEILTAYSLGVDEQSPALSFRIDVSQSGEITLEEIVPTWVRVTRMNYSDADRYLRSGGGADESDESAAKERSATAIREINEICHRAYQLRLHSAAPAIDLPEVRISLENNDISIRPLHVGPSRNLVLESMLMVGYTMGRYAIEHDIPIPYTVQSEPDIDEVPTTLAAMWSARRKYRRSEHTTIPGAHAGLGLPCYVRSTSPLRRYLDLVAHQQLRGVLFGGIVRSRDEIIDAISQSDMRSADVTRAERASNRHFTLAYLLEHPDWTGEAVVVGTGRNTMVIVPDLALEAELVARDSYDVDEIVYVTVDSIRLPTLDCVLIPS